MDEQHQIQASTAISDADIAEELRSLESLVCPEILQWLLAPPVQLEQLESLAPAVDVDAVIERALQRVDSSTSGVVASKIAQSQLHPLLDSQPRLLPERANQPHPSSSRFGAPITTEDLFSVIDKRVPENTKRTTSWGYKVWNEWCEARNIHDKIVDMEASMMNELLARFVQEARRKDGKEYPASSLHNIVSAVQRHLRENGRPEISFFDEKSPTFDLLRKSLDARMKELTSKGIGCMKKQAQPISPEMENTLWEKEIFSRNTGQGLINIVFWYSSKMFGLRGSDEHRNLDANQFLIQHDESGHYLRFVGKSCKNWQGGLHQRKIQAKDLKIYAKPQLEERCAVSCFGLYLSLIPSEGPFYRRPIGDRPPRYSKQVIGVHKLETTVKTFCMQAGFTGNYTNHSGKVTCATELFRHNVDEQLIMHQTGHRSQDAVRMYKRPAEQHQQQVSDILQPPAKKKSANQSLQENTVPNTLSSSSGSSTLPFNFSVSGSGTQNIYISYTK